MVRRYDAIVVGSGFGGAPVACRLAEAGRKVLVLERGREWRAEDYPRAPGDAWLWDDDHPERHNGWIDARFFGHMTVIQGAGVGGGSLIYANVSVEAEPWAFERGWPPGISYESLAPHYAEVGRMLDVHELPDGQLTERTKLMRDGAEALGHGDRVRKLPLAVTFSDDWHYGLEDAHDAKWSKRWTNAHGQVQGTCIHCGNCDIGCRVGAKNTLDLNYLAAARASGAELRPLHVVRSIAPLDDGYSVGVDRIEDGRLIADDCAARIVVLAAGSLGSTELLLRCRDDYRTLPNVSRRLGLGWSSNGDFLTPAVYRDRRVSPTRGPTITAAIDFLDGSRDGRRFFVEDGGFPDAIGNTIGELAQSGRRLGGVLGKAFARLAKEARGGDPLDCVMPWFGQAADASNGRLYLGRRWWWPFGPRKILLDWDVADSEATIQAMVDMHKALSRATGGVPIEPLYWRWAKDLITPHPLGGCALGSGPADGVVGAGGEVFGHPGLYVADGAILPKAIGLNPSRTIAALAEHVAQGILSG
ncbi:MAG TPA: GMC family oxidoreductase [Alphaproteobacteria bacterium]